MWVRREKRAITSDSSSESCGGATLVEFGEGVEVSGEEGTEREKRMWGRKIAGGSLGSRKNELSRWGAEVPERRGFKSQGSSGADAENRELRIPRIRGQIVGFPWRGRIVKMLRLCQEANRRILVAERFDLLGTCGIS